MFQEASARGVAKPDGREQTQYQNPTLRKELGALDSVILAKGLGIVFLSARKWLAGAFTMMKGRVSGASEVSLCSGSAGAVVLFWLMLTQLLRGGTVTDRVRKEERGILGM